MKVHTRRKPKHHRNCKLHCLTEITTNQSRLHHWRRTPEDQIPSTKTGNRQSPIPGTKGTARTDPSTCTVHVNLDAGVKGGSAPYSDPASKATLDRLQIFRARYEEAGLVFMFYCSNMFNLAACKLTGGKTVCFRGPKISLTVGRGEQSGFPQAHCQTTPFLDLEVDTMDFVLEAFQFLPLPRGRIHHNAFVARTVRAWKMRRALALWWMLGSWQCTLVGLCVQRHRMCVHSTAPWGLSG